MPNIPGSMLPAPPLGGVVATADRTAAGQAASNPVELNRATRDRRPPAMGVATASGRHANIINLAALPVQAEKHVTS